MKKKSNKNKIIELINNKFESKIRITIKSYYYILIFLLLNKEIRKFIFLPYAVSLFFFLFSFFSFFSPKLDLDSAKEV